MAEQDRQLLRLVSEGLKTKEIAVALCLSPRDVSSRLERICEEMGVKDRFELVLSMFWRAAASAD